MKWWLATIVLILVVNIFLVVSLISQNSVLTDKLDALTSNVHDLSSASNSTDSTSSSTTPSISSLLCNGSTTSFGSTGTINLTCDPE